MNIITTFNRDEIFEGKVTHHRLRVFKEKGFNCKICNIEGDNVKLTKSDNGSIHLDLYSGNRLMTIDHIIPKSKGGNNHINNLEPMCCECNFKKGNILEDSYKEGKI